MSPLLWIICLLLTAALPGRIHAADSQALPTHTIQQIENLRQEKLSRTPAQRKLDSQLIYGARAAKVAKGQALFAGAASLQADLTLRPDNTVLVDVDAVIDDALLARIAAGGGTVLSSFPRYQTLRALIPIALAETLAQRPEVRFIRPAALARTNRRFRAPNVRKVGSEGTAPFAGGVIANIGSVTSAGDGAHQADLARSVFGVDGTGIKIGVLSDSIDFLSTSQANGDLDTVTILPGQAGSGTGEGTAMLEIIHDLAPGAQLYFATAFTSDTSFAQNIRDLRSAGCDIIVDDVSYFNESPFQNGPIAQAVNDVSASGALYFSSAGNSGNKNDGTSGTWEGDFRDGGTTPISTGRIHDFGGATFNTVAAGGSSRRADLFWPDPLGASTNDYDLYITDSSGNILRASDSFQNGTSDPYEAVSTLNVGERIVIVKFSGADRFLHLDTGRARLTISTDGNTRGHNAGNATNAFCVAAVPATTPPATFTGGGSNPVETFSSDGPRRIFFHTDGSPITPGNFTSTGGAVLQKPDITAADGVATSVSGFTSFFGTSASAPHAGAIAALIKSDNPALTPAQIRTALQTSALDIEAVGIDRDSGAGIIMALGALQAAQSFRMPSLHATGSALISENCSPANGLIDPGEAVTVSLLLTNNGTAKSSNLVATLLNGNGVTFAGVPQAYGVLLTNGPEVAQSFSFVADGACGSNIVATLQLQDGTNDLGTVSFAFTLGCCVDTNAADLGVTITASPAPSVLVGSNLTYTIVVTNSGPATATNIFVSNSLPASVTYLAANSSQGTCTNSGNTVLCNVGSLAVGDFATVTIEVNAPTTASLVAAAVVTSDAFDFNSANNTAINTVTAAFPVLTISDATATEGNTTTTNALFAVGLAEPYGQIVTVNFSTTNLTANAGPDYVATNGTLTFLPGETNRIVAVEVVADFFQETTETFAVVLSSPANAILGRTNGIGTILDNDPQPGISIESISITEGNIGITNAVFTVSLTGPSGQPVSVRYATANNSAVAGSDYLARSGTVAFPPGSTNQTITVPVVGDTNVELNESFFVNLSLATNATIATANASAIIVNDDSLLGEVNRFVWSAISSNQLTDTPIAVTITAQDGTLSPATNFQGPAILSGVLTSAIPAPSIVITEMDPGTPDSVEFMNVSATALDIGNWQITLYDTQTFPAPLTNYVVPPGTIVPAGGVFRLEESGTFPGAYPAFFTGQNINWINGASAPMAVLLRNHTNAIIDFVCAAGATASSITSPVTIPASQWNGSPITGNANTAVDYQRAGVVDSNSSSNWVLAASSIGTANVGLTAPFQGGSTNFPITSTFTGAFTNGIWAGFVTVSQPVASMVLQVTDSNGHTNNSTAFSVNPAHSLMISDATIAEGDAGITALNFVVSLVPTSAVPVSVNFTTVDGTANAGSDYFATNGTLVLQPGDTNQTITVFINGDTAVEADENFSVILSGATGAFIITNSAIGTILTDDFPAPLANQPRNDFWIPNGTVNTVLETNGSIYLGGTFTELGVTNVGRFASFNPATGDVLQGFPLVNDVVNAVIDDGTGGWFIGGNFTKVGGVNAFRLAHILPNRAVDTNFNASFNSSVQALAIDATNIYVGGAFTNATNGATLFQRAGLAVLDLATGAVRTYPNNAAFSGPAVSTIVIRSNVLYVGGSFTNVIHGGTNYPRFRLAALDTASTQPKTWIADADGGVNALALGSNAVFAGGTFTRITNAAIGSTRSRFAALDFTTGAPAAIATHFNGSVNTLLCADNTLYVGGQFLGLTNGVTTSTNKFLVALDANSGAVATWSPGANNTVRALAMAGTNLFVGGDFTSIGGQADRRRLAEMNTVSGIATAFDPSLGDSVNAVSVRSNLVYAGGTFTFIKGTLRNRAAALSAETGALLPWNPNADGTILALAASGTNIYLGGLFTNVGGLNRARLAAVDSTNGTVATNFSTTINGAVKALAIGGTNIYVGGEFTTPRQGLMALDPTSGVTRSSFTAELSPAANSTNAVNALIFSSNTVFVAGSFTNVSSTTRLRLAALDSATGIPSSWNPSPNNSVLAIALKGNTLFLGGNFTGITSAVGSGLRNRLVAVATDSSTTLSWNPNVNASVNALAVRGSNVYVGGAFTTIAGQPRTGLAQFDSLLASNTPTAWNTAPQTTVNALAAAEHRLIVGGSFTSFAEQSLPALAVFQPNSAPILNLNGSPLTYTEGDPATAIDSGLTISDADGALLASATIRIIGNFQPAEDLLEFTSANGISGFYFAPGGSLTLTGQSTLSNYVTALRSVSYRNTSQNPSPAPRLVEVTVNDGITNSPTATRTINVVPVNVPPTITSILDQTVIENQPTPPLAFIIGDSDSAVTNLVVSGSSSNSALVPTNNFSFTVSGSNASVIIFPATNQSGVTTVTLSVSDGIDTTDTSFIITVLADSDHDGIPDVYEVAHGMNANDPADAALDFDGDGLSNLQEYLAGTDPNDSSNYLRIVTVTIVGDDLQVGFTSIAGKSYRVERADDVTGGMWLQVEDNIPGTGGIVVVTDTAGSYPAQRAYRVRLLP